MKLARLIVKLAPQGKPLIMIILDVINVMKDIMLHVQVQHAFNVQ